MLESDKLREKLEKPQISKYPLLKNAKPLYSTWKHIWTAGTQPEATTVQSMPAIVWEGVLHYHLGNQVPAV